jgi:1-acyl-sn-glycerol-3-phosphate acyltransferase
MFILDEIGRIVVKLLFHSRFDLKYTFDDFDPKTKETYMLIGNHATQHDPLIVGMKIKRYPYPVANSFLYTSKVISFLLTKVVHSISKRKGQSDAQTIIKIIRTIKDKKRSVMLFPEGNASYFGKESPVLYEATAKLLKKLEVDVIFAHIRGGYLSHPRWGNYRKKGHFHVHFQKLIKKEDLHRLSLEAITLKLKEAFVFNDYTWNQTHKYTYPLKGSQNGIEHYIYYCPTCKETQTLLGVDEHITCKTCGVIATFDTHMQMTGPYPSIIEWDIDQKSHIKEIITKDIHSQGIVYDIDLVKRKKVYLGNLDMTLNQTHLILHHKNPLKLNINEISGIVITQKNRLSFDYLDKTYNIIMKDPMLYLDSILYIQGDVTWNNGQ